MESWLNRWSRPPSWVLTIRLVEAAVLACIASALLELWVASRSAENFAPAPGDGSGSPTVTSLADRFLAMSLISFRGPTAMVVAAVLVLGLLLAARRVTSHARVVVLLWEQLALAAVILLVSLLQLVGLVVASGSGSGFYEGRERAYQLLISGGAPLTAALICVVFGLWWWPVRQEADQRAAAEFAEAQAAAGLVVADQEVWTEAEMPGQRPTGDPLFAWSAPRTQPGTQPGPDPAARGELAGSDFAQAEVIEAAPAPERATSPGYDDYFRRP